MKKSIIKPILFIAILSCVAALHPRPFILFIVLAGLCYLLLRIDNFAHLKSFIIIGALGSLSEIFCIYFGAWQYAVPQLAGIPIWLPLVWGAAGIAFISAATRFSEFKVK